MHLIKRNGIEEDTDISRALETRFESFSRYYRIKEEK